MVKNKNEFTISELVYYAFFALMLFAKGMGLYAGQWPYTVTLVVATGLIFVKLLITEHTIPEWIFIILMIALSITIYCHSQKIGILVITATIIGMKGVSVKRIMWIGTIVWSFTFILNILLVLTGVRDDIIRVQEKLGLGYIIRYSLGQTHPNVLQISYMIFCAFILYVANLRGKKLIRTTFLMMLGSLYIFMYSVSYTGIVLCVFYFLINLYLAFRKKIGIVEGVASIALVLFCVYLTVYVFNHIDYPYYYYINKYLNTRPFITYYYMHNTPIKLFGTGYNEELPLASNNLDSSFIYALMHYGVIFFVLFVVGYMSLIIYLCRTNRKLELGIVISFVAAAITEPFFVNESFKNISWIFIGEFAFDVLGFLDKRLDSNLSLGVKKNFKIELPVQHIFDGFQILKGIYINKKRMIALWSIAFGIIIAVAYMYVTKVKEPYYINRSIVQTESKDYMTIDINELPDDFSGKIVRYVDDETPMIMVEGMIGYVERCRSVISIFVLGTFGVSVVNILLLVCKNKNGKYRV